MPLPAPHPHLAPAPVKTRTSPKFVIARSEATWQSLEGVLLMYNHGHHMLQGKWKSLTYRCFSIHFE